jgi:hypothetical protein
MGSRVFTAIVEAFAAAGKFANVFQLLQHMSADFSTPPTSFMFAEVIRVCSMSENSNIVNRTFMMVPQDQLDSLVCQAMITACQR